MSHNIVGKPIPLIDALDKVKGKAKYTDDILIDNPLIIKLLRSPHASARILDINKESACKIKGVKAIITGEDFVHTFGVLPISKDEPPLAKKIVRYVGEPVVAVATESEKIATLALEKIEIKYQLTDPCLKADDALRETDNPIHPELKRTNNLHKSVDQQFGNLEEGFKKADITVEAGFDFPSVSHAFTEPHATQVEIKDRGITVYSSTQVPHYLHKAIAEVLELPMHKIRVIKPKLGGGFGGKSDPFNHELVAVKLALITNRNTKVVLDRQEVFFCHHGRHSTKINMALGSSKTKGITALQGDMLIDGGAYGSFGVVTSYYNGVLLQGPYKIPNFAFHCDRVYTNKPMCGAMRGHGGVNPRFATEVLLDMACRDLQVDPCDFRLKHFLEENSLTSNQFRITSVGIKDGLQQIMKRCDWKNKYGKLPFGKGIGVACGFFISGSALPIVWNKMPQSTVRLTIVYDGGVTLYSGASDIGQGSDTMLAQVVAEVLGLPIDMIKVVSADTRLCPIDYGSYSSRVTFMAGNAARNAAIRMRRQLIIAACRLKNISPPSWEQRNKINLNSNKRKQSNSDDNLFSELLSPYDPESEPDANDRIDNPEYFKQGSQKPQYGSSYLGANPDFTDGFCLENQEIKFPSGEVVSYQKTVHKALDYFGALQSRGIYVSPQLGGNFKGSGAGLSPSYSFTAVITEVDIDVQTGFVKVDKVTMAHDCGFALNPLMVEGQLEGSIHMGLGQALSEAIVYKNGITQNAGFLEYKMLTPMEMPQIDLVYPVSNETEGPFGAKEVGEGALAPVLPSVANAVYDAVGVRINSLPITPDKVLASLTKKKKTI